MNTTPLWVDQYPRPADLPISTELPTQVDVAIVGSGYTGLNAARVLAESGASVAVLERETIGWGASSRNGGMATPGIKQSAPTMFKMYGKELGSQFWQASMDAIDLVGQVVADEGIDCDWSRPGHLAVAYKPSHFESMKKSAVWYEKELDYKMTVIDPADIRSEIGSDVFYGGLTHDYAGAANPAKYVFGLAQAVANKGVKLCEQTAVSRITKQANGFAVQTSQGMLQAKEVLVATNGYTDQLVPKLKPSVFPVGSYIIVTEPLPQALQQKLSPKGRMFFDSKNFLNYFRLTPNGRFLWGGRNDLSTDLDLHDSANILQQQLVHTFPELKDVPITHSWTGQLGITFDLMPHIGRINGVHYALGYGGHGLSIATYIGTEAGKLMSGQISQTPFAEITHPTMPFYRNKPWFIPFAAWYYRFLDWIS